MTNKAPKPSPAQIGLLAGAGKIASLALLTALAPLATTPGNAQSISPNFTNIWYINISNRWDLVNGGSGPTERGIGMNPVNGNVIYSSRLASNHVTTVNGNTGALIGELPGGIPNVYNAGTLAMVHVRGSDDGSIYVANLCGSSASTLRLYRYASDTDTNPPATVFSTNGLLANLFSRVGDAMDIRGSGTNTQIILSGSASGNPGTNVVILSPSDDTLTNQWNLKILNYPAGVAAGSFGAGITFDGTNNAFFAKIAGNANTYYVGYDPNTGNCTLSNTFALTTDFYGLKVFQTNGFRLLAGLKYSSSGSSTTPQKARVYDITSLASPTLVLDANLPGTNGPSGSPNFWYLNANPNGNAAVRDNRITFLGANDGITTFELYWTTNPPPALTSQPTGNTNILTGGYYRLTAAATGGGLKYQWYLGAAPAANATNSTLNLTNLTAAQAGSYTVVVTNIAGAVTSNPAIIGLIPSTQSSVSSILWRRGAGSLSYLTSGNTERGMAYHALSNQVLVVSRSTGTKIYCIDANTGNAVTNLDMTGVGGKPSETFPLNMIGVADDGAIYACNLANINTGAGFTIYRWADANPGTQPTIAYGPDAPVNERIGDTFAVQGSGLNTRLIAATRTNTVVVVFTTGDGVTFTPNIVDVSTAPAGFAGLGLAAGGGDYFWATSGGYLLRKVYFDLVNTTNEVQLALAGQTGNNVGIDPINQMATSIGTSDTPSNLRILELADQTVEAPTLDQEFFGTDNDNVNFTGAVAMDVPNGRIFALDSNNGLLALKYAGRLKANKIGSSSVLSWAVNTAVLQSATNVNATYTDVPAATSPYTNSSGSEVYFRLRR